MSSTDNTPDSRKLLAVIISAIFVVELFMGILFGYFIAWPLWVESILDASLLIIILFPILRRFILRPFTDEIDKRRTIEEQLRIRSMAIESAENVIFITDRNGNFQWVNPAFTRLTGYTAEDAIGKTPRILKSGQHKQDYYVRLWETILAGNPWRDEVVDRGKKGNLFTVDQIITPIKDDHGNVTHFVAIQHDVTERATYQKSVEDSKARDEAIISSIGDGIALMDANGMILSVNRTFETMTGYGSGDLIGKNLIDVVRAEDLTGVEIPKDRRLVPRTLAPPFEKVEEKYRLVKKDGSKVDISTIVSPVNVNGKVIGVVQAYRDITREQEIDRAKTEFVSLASHQLRTPLSTINWYTEMLLNGDAGAVNDKQKEYLGEVYGGSKRMVELVNSLLNVSRIETGSFGIEPQTLHPKELIDEILKDFASEINRKHLHVETTYNDVESVTADPKLLRLIFQNLLANAVQYTPEGGSVRLAAFKHEPDIRFTVTDTGIGVPWAEREKIFTKMYRADNARSTNPNGNGLGLYMVKSILDHAGGSIWFESAEGKGSTFYVTIPIGGMQKKAGTKSLS